MEPDLAVLACIRHEGRAADAWNQIALGLFFPYGVLGHAMGLSGRGGHAGAAVARPLLARPRKGTTLRGSPLCGDVLNHPFRSADPP